MQTVLVACGLGYIGSHTVVEIMERISGLLSLSIGRQTGMNFLATFAAIT